MKKSGLKEKRKFVKPELLFNLINIDRESKEIYEEAIEYIFAERGQKVSDYLKASSEPEVVELPEVPVTPTEIGKLLANKWKLNKPLRPNEVNKILIKLKLQERHRKASKRLYYTLTPLGEKFAVVIKTTLPESSTPHIQVKWFPKLLTEFLTKQFQKPKDN